MVMTRMSVQKIGDWTSNSQVVMRGLDPPIHVFKYNFTRKRGYAGQARA
jgi:hypothetical protein